MNRSGQSVGEARDFYKLANDDLLIVCDDFNLALGKLRMRIKGSSGGQKGLEDCIRRLGTDEFARLRIGVGNPPAGWDASDWVLGRLPPKSGPNRHCGAASGRCRRVVGHARGRCRDECI